MNSTHQILTSLCIEHNNTGEHFHVSTILNKADKKGHNNYYFKGNIGRCYNMLEYPMSQKNVYFKYIHEIFMWFYT